MSFFSSLFSEFTSRRRRLRRALGDRAEGLVEMVILGGIVAGSLGLLLAPWMAPAAPWGFSIPFVFAGGYAWLDLHRQRALATVEGEAHVPDDEGRAHAPAAHRITRTHDAMALALALICAASGAATFAIAYQAAPREAAPPPMDENWQPPSNAVEVDVAPGP